MIGRRVSAGAALAVAVLALTIGSASSAATAATCSTVSVALVRSTLGGVPTAPTRRTTKTKSGRTALECAYGKHVLITYVPGESAAAFRASFIAAPRSYEPHPAVTKVTGIGNGAFSVVGPILSVVNGKRVYTPLASLEVLAGTTIFAITVAPSTRASLAGEEALAKRMVPLVRALKPPPAPKPAPTPAPSTGPATVTADTLVSRGPIKLMAADGDRVAYSSCGHVLVWAPATKAVTPVDGFQGTICDPSELVPPIVSALAVAGNRVVYELVTGGNLPGWILRGVTLDSALTPLSLPSAGGVCCAGEPLKGILGYPTGSGSLLIFSSYDTNWPGGQCCSPTVTTEQRIQRVGPSGCDCPVIATQPGPFVPLDVDGGRFLATGDNTTLIQDGNGAVLLQIPTPALGGALAGNDAVLLTAGELRDYDATNGALLHTWPVPNDPGLKVEDATAGLVAYIVGGQLHLLRLSDGRDATIGPATIARFMSAGLVYANDATIRLTTFAALPLS